jgi:16S rRNA (guanine(966)-N(2))-methyltransferase RsmD
VPANLKARPTTDFAKENLFNILNNRIEWEATTALDLFSGTGSIALELVSRGCPYVISVEMNALHYNFICKTQELLGAKELFPIRGDAFKYLKSARQKFDFIFADPPYNLPDAAKIPEIIIEKQLVKEGGMFVMEHSKSLNFSHLPHFSEERVYGSVCFSIFGF